nr:MAG TPA: hypothetical protein [Bacteriophage sp.]DAX07241.1 MAG TPA: hypothetical protein [Bacteriophage sp.]
MYLYLHIKKAIGYLKLNTRTLIREPDPSGRCVVRSSVFIVVEVANANAHRQIPIYLDGNANKH